MNYTVDLGSGSMTYIYIFINIGLHILNYIRGKVRYTDTQRAWRSHKPTFIFSKQGK
jgi:hypothetical protein